MLSVRDLSLIHLFLLIGFCFLFKGQKKLYRQLKYTENDLKSQLKVVENERQTLNDCCNSTSLAEVLEQVIEFIFCKFIHIQC